MFNRIFDNLKIRTKLILLFILIKVIPFLIIAMIALYGIDSLHTFFNQSSLEIKKTAKEVVTATANTAMKDSIEALDKRTQSSLEILTAQIAQHVANFLYERDDDIKFLSTLKPNESAYATFLKTKQRDITYIDLEEFIYDENLSSWNRQENKVYEKVYKRADLLDNQKEFHRVDTYVYPAKKIPIYKEVTFFDLNGVEKIKISALDPTKKDISQPQNTYLKAEDYFLYLSSLKEGEIYVSDVIGEYVGTKVIGTFNKQNAQKARIAFEPEKYAYAGKENPKGKRFEGIIRFVMPVILEGKKIGYVSLALDHRHIMEFTDTIDPLNYSKTDIPDAGRGNYAFMWDYKGRNISHPRDYFIVGFDKRTGKRVPPWVSQDIQEKFEASSFTDLNTFLESYPQYENQSLSKKPNILQIRKEELALDCRYLNFAPQCQGWMQLTQNGGVGSFVIFWSDVWKLTTASVIPYFTSQYGTTARGFGFVTLGANVDDFHKSANEIKQTVDNFLMLKFSEIDGIIENVAERVKDEVNTILDEFTYVIIFMILFMILIAIWLSNHLRSRLTKLLLAAKEFSSNNLAHRITESSKDEIGELANSFNEMLESLEQYINTEKELKFSLEKKVQDRTAELSLLNQQIQRELNIKVEQEEKLEIFAKIFSNTLEAIVITDIDGKILQINKAFTNITQYTPEEIVGTDMSRFRSHRHDDLYFEQMWNQILNKQIWEGEIWNYKKDGTLYPALISIIPILNKEQEISYFVAIQHDITTIKEHEEELHKQAYYDGLTKLANRSLGYERLKHAIEKAENTQNKVAVLFLDLDKFKNINDTMGHDIGDLLLVEVANRLRNACHSSDTVCRLGGDEFLIVLEDVTSYNQAIVIIEKILHDMAQPFMIASDSIHTSTSIGVTFYPDDSKEYTMLLKYADIAMYRAKALGRNTFEIFTEALNEQFKETVRLEDQIKQGIHNDEFYMVFQPIYTLKNHQIAGFEALMRWKRNGIEYAPSVFMKILENSRMIIDATYKVLPETLRFIAQLNKTFQKDFFISINISSVQFGLEEFNENLVSMVNAAKILPKNICLEVTESIFLHDIQSVATKLEEIKELGFTIALDDFGTGYSSLQYIKNLPIDKIKLDRSFIQGLPHSSGDKAIINAIVSLAQNLSMKLIAEGIETDEQLDYLKSIDCQYAQGYLFARPKTKEEIQQLVKSHHIDY